MKNLLLAIAAATIGAIGFHAYYLSIDSAARCDLDRTLGTTGSDACRAGAEPALYDRAARKTLDDLVDKVDR